MATSGKPSIFSSPAISGRFCWCWRHFAGASGPIAGNSIIVGQSGDGFPACFGAWRGTGRAGQYETKAGFPECRGFSGGMGKSVILEGCLIGALALLAFTIGRLFFDSNPMEPATGRTMAFAVLSFSQIAHTFNMRSEHSLLPSAFSPIPS